MLTFLSIIHRANGRLPRVAFPETHNVDPYETRRMPKRTDDSKFA